MKDSIIKMWPLFLIAAASAIAVLLFSFTFDIFQFGDNCGYMSLGMAFAEGRGFIDPALPGSHHFLWWPPGFPLFIALFNKICGPQWNLLKIIIFLFLYFSLILFAIVIYKNEASRMKAALILLALCFSSGIHLLSSYLYSETFCIACSLLFFFIWYKCKEELKIWKIVLLSLFAVYINSVRLIGICLPVALTIYLLIFSKGDPKSKWYAVIPCSLVIIYLTISLFVPAWRVDSFRAAMGLHHQFGSMFTGKNISEPLSSIRFTVYYYEKVIRFLRGYGLTLIPQALIRSTYDFYGMNRLKAAAMSIITALVIAGWSVTFKKYKLINIYILLFMTVLLVYGPLYVRLVVPIIPFLFLYFYSGIETGIILFIRNKKVSFAFLTIVWLYVIFDNALRTFTDPHRTMPPKFGDNQYQRCIEWVVKNTKSKEVVLSQTHSYLFLRRGQYCIPYISSKTANEFMAYLDAYNVKYIIISPFSVRPNETYMNSAIRATDMYSYYFREVFGDKRNTAYILEYFPGKL